MAIVCITVLWRTEIVGKCGKKAHFFVEHCWNCLENLAKMG